MIDGEIREDFKQGQKPSERIGELYRHSLAEARAKPGWNDLPETVKAQLQCEHLVQGVIDYLDEQAG